MTPQPPKIALLLGWGGVIPFAAAAIAKLMGGPLMGLYALTWGTVYAGVIITFIGAVHWGIAIHKYHDRKPTLPLVWSVLPALAVWPVLTLPPLLRIPFLVFGLLIVWGADMLAYKRGHLPAWYMNLRHGLTAVASSSLVVLSLA